MEKACDPGSIPGSRIISLIIEKKSWKIVYPNQKKDKKNYWYFLASTNLYISSKNLNV